MRGKRRKDNLERKNVNWKIWTFVQLIQSENVRLEHLMIHLGNNQRVQQLFNDDLKQDSRTVKSKGVSRSRRG